LRAGEWYLSRKVIFSRKNRNDFNRFKTNLRRSGLSSSYFTGGM